MACMLVLGRVMVWYKVYGCTQTKVRTGVEVCYTVFGMELSLHCDDNTLLAVTQHWICHMTASQP
jgi:hypothetical protein